MNLKPDRREFARRRIDAYARPTADADAGILGGKASPYAWTPPELREFATSPNGPDNQLPRTLRGPALRLYAGRAEPDDSSRFFIRYSVDGVGGFLRGQLQGDDSVRLVPEGPLADGWTSNDVY